MFGKIHTKLPIQNSAQKPGIIPAGMALANHPQHVELWTDQNI